LKDLLLLFGVFIKVLLAKTYVKAISRVAAILTAKKAPMFVLAMPAIKGFNSLAPEYRTPITVVKQSMEPIRIRSKLGIISAFNIKLPSRFLSKTYFKAKYL
jgi:hypothetical protein